MEKNAKKSFLIYYDSIEAIESLSDADAGQLFKAVIAYAAEGREPDPSLPCYTVFLFLKAQIRRDNEKYDEICRKRSEAGKKGWEVMMRNRQMPGIAGECPAEPAYIDTESERASVIEKDIHSDSDSVTESDTVTVSYSDREIGRESPKAIPFGKAAFGRYGNVILSERERLRLKGEYKGADEDMIERLSEYLHETGRHYGNHFAVLCHWADFDKETYPGRQKSTNIGFAKNLRKECELHEAEVRDRRRSLLSELKGLESEDEPL